MRVYCLVGCHRVQPRSNFPAGLELIAFQMDLKERLLEHVLGSRGVAHVVSQVAVQLPFVPMHQNGKHPTISPRTIAQQEFFVGTGLDRFEAFCTKPHFFNCAAHFFVRTGLGGGSAGPRHPIHAISPRTRLSHHCCLSLYQPRRKNRQNCPSNHSQWGRWAQADGPAASQGNHSFAFYASQLPCLIGKCRITRPGSWSKYRPILLPLLYLRRLLLQSDRLPPAKPPFHAVAGFSDRCVLRRSMAPKPQPPPKGIRACHNGRVVATSACPILSSRRNEGQGSLRANHCC